jgi:hypothetical protein
MHSRLPERYASKHWIDRAHQNPLGGCDKFTN